MSSAITTSKQPCPDTPEGGCSICGEGLCVTSFDTIFSFPGQPSVECGVLEKAGRSGVVPLDQCGYLPGIVKDDCKCSNGVPLTTTTSSSSSNSNSSSQQQQQSSSDACPDVPDDGCSVCGPGMCVTDSDAIFEFPGQPSVRCEDLEKAGLSGIVPLGQCGFLPGLVQDKCKCLNKSVRPIAPSTPPTPYPAPTQQIPTAHQERTSCPDVPDDGCSVCGPGMCVNDFDAIFEFPGQPSVRCEDLEKAGLSGIIPLGQCGFLPGLVQDKCECLNKSVRPIAPSTPPTPYPAPTQQIPTAPTRNPRPAPTQQVPTFPIPSPTKSVFSSSRPPHQERTSCPEVPDDGCSVCGPSMCVTDFDAIFEFPGQPSVPCGELEKAGISGIIPLSQCGFLPGLVADKCKCQNESLRPITPAPRPPSINPPTRPTTTTITPPHSANKCPEIPGDGCSVCGPSMCVTDFDAVFEFPGQPAVKCGDLQNAGIDGIVPLDQCGFLPGLILDTCKCKNENMRPTAPTMPTHTPTYPPLPDNKCRAVPDKGCSVCGPGMCVTDFDAMFEFPGQPTVRCSDLENAGLNGIVPLDQCGFLPGLVAEKCKCHTQTSMSKPSRQPTRAPTLKPWPEQEFTYAPFYGEDATSYSSLTEGRGADAGSGGLIVGLTIGVSVVGVLILFLAVCILRKRRRSKKTMKDATTVGFVLDADGTSIVKAKRENMESKATDNDDDNSDDIDDDDQDLL